MASRKGSLLEKNVEMLLSLSGFKPTLNKIVDGYEIDVYLAVSGNRIAFECKQYERSSLHVRNLIHQWDSKNKELNFDKIVLVLVGCDISRKDYQLAKKYGIIIWDEKKLTNLLDQSVELKTQNQENILKEIDLGDVEPDLVEKEELVTPQQIEIRKAIEELLSNNKNSDGFINFHVKNNYAYVGAIPDEDKIRLNTSINQSIISILDSIGFTKNNEFEFHHSRHFDEIIIYCGKDHSFTSMLVDRIFKEGFGLEKDYKLNIEVSLES